MSMCDHCSMGLCMGGKGLCGSVVVCDSCCLGSGCVSGWVGLCVGV